MAANIGTHNSTYNISLNLTSLLNLPSRFLARIRKIDDFINQNTTQNTEFVPANASISQHEAAATYPRRHDTPPSLTPFPGPWGFLTSGYAITLFAMAVLIHRIQNIVVPPRRPPAYLLNQRSRRLSYLRALYSYILPLDLSSTRTRLILHLPTLYLLTKMLCVWFIILLQMFEVFPSSAHLEGLGKWVSGKSMDAVCWGTFSAVCGAFCVEALVRGLEGSGATSNTSPFNLCGYAFLLHIYSSPITHVNKIDDQPSRPDKHVIVTIAIPLLQLTLLHILSVNKRYARHRLIPTALASFLSLLHFHLTLLLAPSSYPLLAYTPNLFESLLIIITMLTISLNALTQLLLEGAVTRPLFAHRDLLVPRWDEDFGVALLRVGTASLEATSLAGLGNEVGGVALSAVVEEAEHAQTQYGSVEMNWLGVSEVKPTVVHERGKLARTRKGWRNEVRNVRAAGRRVEGLSAGDVWMDMPWYRELGRFGVGIAKCLKGAGLAVWGVVRGKRWAVLRPASQRRQEFSGAGGASGWGEGDDVDGDEVGTAYGRFLRGEEVSDDESDDDFNPVPHSSSSSLSSEEDPDDDEDSSDDGLETVGLYADLASTSTGTPLLLAHMADSERSPLTRRRYGALVGGNAGLVPTSNLPAEHSTGGRTKSRKARDHARDSDVDSDTRRNCVICTAEPRQIICWPCRCLALCDDCRDNLASRSSASKHKCPCCRRGVEGYSRVYIP